MTFEINQADLDTRLDREIAALRAPVEDHGLWERIETALEHEKLRAAAAGRKSPAGASGLRAFFARRWMVLAPAGAALIVLAVLGTQLLRRPLAQSDLLTREALTRVETTENQYLGAIEALERRARPKLAAMDIQMMSLYRDKLAMVDAQIGRCRNALNSNPGNAHIRRYLLAALQDKRSTLADVLGSSN
jgi:hypothetical protein